MRILLVNAGETTAPGGINRTVSEIARHLSMRGHEVTILQPNPQCLCPSETREGFRIIRVKSSFGQRFAGLSPEVYSYLRRHFKELQPDIVHLHGYHNLFSPEVAYIISKISPKTPLAFSLHLDQFRSTFIGKHFWWLHNRLVGKTILKISDRIVGFSSFETSLIKRTLGAEDDRVSVIPHGVNVIDLTRIPRMNSTIRLLYVGYLIQRKGVQYVLRGLHALTKDQGNSSVTLTIVGEGPEKGVLMRLAEDLGLTNYITWLPFLPEGHLINVIKTSDLLLLLSESEAFGIVVAEALALGTPALVANNTALKEFLIEPGCFGVDYPPDPKQVANLVMEIGQSQTKVGPFSKRIRTWDVVAQDYERLYEEILRSKSR